MATKAVPETELIVPDDDSPARCPYCHRPFRTERFLALHLGDDHADSWTDAEQEAYEDAREAEADALFIYHLKIVAALVGLYAFFFMAYLAVSMAQV
ncbi:DUF7410 domain-containing protein [Halorussus halophilus]|uniref:DUF7410 domain-containing protein n=1 Tax=Halorussus halophilus TaxID=2650975 RepID=UPI0013011313|nr:hypothetical protein [Halorussus halophilus]